MSNAQLISFIGVLFALLVTLVGVIWRLLTSRIERLEARDNSAVLLSRVDAIADAFNRLEGRFEQRAKDKDQFDYNFRHGQYVDDITSINTRLWPLMQKVEDLEKRLDGLHEWKHVVGEAYLPRAVDDIERRVGKLESKVFNGHGVMR